MSRGAEEQLQRRLRWLLLEPVLWLAMLQLEAPLRRGQMQVGVRERHPLLRCETTAETGGEGGEGRCDVHEESGGVRRDWATLSSAGKWTGHGRLNDEETDFRYADSRSAERRCDLAALHLRLLLHPLPLLEQLSLEALLSERVLLGCMLLGQLLPPLLLLLLQQQRGHQNDSGVRWRRQERRGKAGAGRRQRGWRGRRRWRGRMEERRRGDGEWKHGGGDVRWR